MIEKLLRLLKTICRGVYINFRYIRKNYTIKDREAKYAILNFDHRLKTEDHSRYYYTICMFLTYAGFKVIVITNWRDFKFFKKPLDFKKLLLKQNYIFVSTASTPINTIVLIQPQTPNHIVHVSYGYHLAYKLSDMVSSGEADCIAPYPAYPMQYKYYFNKPFLESIRKTGRTIKIFFAGDTSKVRYAGAKVQKFFNVLPRLEVIEFIQTYFDGTIQLQNEEGKLMLTELLSATKYVNEIVISRVKTQEEDWLKILSKSDFFICTPGERMPWSHNCVEAMSVGTIPILQYNNLFYPHLENMKNCISFANSEELKMAIEKALTMEPAQIEKMRNNVISYYDQFLSTESILEKIKTFSESPQLEVKIAFPFMATKKEWSLIQTVYTKEELSLLGPVA